MAARYGDIVSRTGVSDRLIGWLTAAVSEALGVARPFPVKRLLFNMDPEIVEERREELQLWLLVSNLKMQRYTSTHSPPHVALVCVA